MTRAKIICGLSHLAPDPRVDTWRAFDGYAEKELASTLRRCPALGRLADEHHASGGSGGGAAGADGGGGSGSRGSRATMSRVQRAWRECEAPFYPVTKGVYAPQLATWLQYFAPSQLIVLDHDEAFGHLGVLACIWQTVKNTDLCVCVPPKAHINWPHPPSTH